MAHPSSRACLFLEPGLLLSAASSGTSATTFAQTCQPCHPGFSLLAGSTASRAIAPERCQRSRAGLQLRLEATALCKKSLSIQQAPAVLNFLLGYIAC